MTEDKTTIQTESKVSLNPLTPKSFPRNIYEFLASVKLAMALLVATLACCLAGVTIWRGARAGQVIFGTLWFNGLLVFLVLNICFCFFGRIWGRRLTMVSFGMILFHLSFVAILLGSVYNSLFCFRGNIRLTEGEVLRSDDPQSYDYFEQGKFFNFSRLKGETTLVKMHAGYKLGVENKRAAYEVAVGEAGEKTTGLIYITHKLTNRGVDYFNEKEGYSLLVTMTDRSGSGSYGAYIPLQSFRQRNGGYGYATGTKDGEVIRPAPLPFPSPPETPRFALQLGYSPSRLQERSGEALFQLYPLSKDGDILDKPFAEAKAPVGQSVPMGDYLLTAKEVRFWVAMMVRYEPGKPIVLASLWAGLAGMLITTIGRMRRGRVKRPQGALIEPGIASQI